MTMPSVPLISVLMPAYNAERYLREAISSVLQQRFSNYELLVINDGSTDNTAGIARSFHDPRIRIVENERNLGLIETLNRGIEEARGQYIARLDADDITLAGRFEAQLKVLSQDPQAVMATGWAQVIDTQGRLKYTARWNFSPEALYYLLHFRNCITHSSVMIRKKALQQVGPYSSAAQHAEDFELWGRLSRVGRIIHLRRAVVRWREHCDSISSVATAPMSKTARNQAAQNLTRALGTHPPDGLISLLLRESDVLRSQPPSRLVHATELFHERLVQSLPSYYDRDRLQRYLRNERRILCHFGHPLYQRLRLSRLPRLLNRLTSDSFFF